MFDNRGAYDKTSILWSPEGELVQLSYARRASQKGASALGAVIEESIILVCERKENPLIESPSKIQEVDKNLFVVSSGLSSDTNLLIQQARYMAQNYQLTYGEPIGPDMLAHKLGELMARHTLTGGLRPFGATLLVAGFHPISDKPRLMYVDTGGTFFPAKAYATGAGADAAVRHLQENFKPDLTLEDGKKILLEAMMKSLSRDTPIAEEETEIKVLTH